MTDLRKAAQMALDWRDKNGELLFALGGWDFIFEINDWSQSLRGALAQPEPEPVAWMYQHEDTGLTMCVIVQQVGAGFEKNNPRWKKITPLYTAPPQREWQGLTDEEVFAALVAVDGNTKRLAPGFVSFYCAIEAKLKEKNT